MYFFGQDPGDDGQTYGLRGEICAQVGGCSTLSKSRLGLTVYFLFLFPFDRVHDNPGAVNVLLFPCGYFAAMDPKARRMRRFVQDTSNYLRKQVARPNNTLLLIHDDAITEN